MQYPTRLPVVLLPGTGLTAADWDVVAVDLSRERTVHAVDLRGHGESDWHGSYLIEAMATDVLELVPQLGSELDLAGHSLGGLVACRVAATSAHVRALVLEDVGVMRPRRPAMPSRPPGDLRFDWAVVDQVLFPPVSSDHRCRPRDPRDQTGEFISTVRGFLDLSAPQPS